MIPKTGSANTLSQAIDLALELAAGASCEMAALIFHEPNTVRWGVMVVERSRAVPTLSMLGLPADLVRRLTIDLENPPDHSHRLAVMICSPETRWPRLSAPPNAQGGVA